MRKVSAYYLPRGSVICQSTSLVKVGGFTLHFFVQHNSTIQKVLLQQFSILEDYCIQTLFYVKNAIFLIYYMYYSKQFDPNGIFGTMFLTQILFSILFVQAIEIRDFACHHDVIETKHWRC